MSACFFSFLPQHPKGVRAQQAPVGPWGHLSRVRSPVFYCDSCRQGATTRAKWGAKRAPAQVTVEQPRRVRGAQR